MTNKSIQQMAAFFKVLGDPTRLRILLSLSDGEVCVSDIAAKADVSASAISHQLRLLKSYHLVHRRKIGKAALYSLHDEHVQEIIEKAWEHIAE